MGTPILQLGPSRLDFLPARAVIPAPGFVAERVELAPEPGRTRLAALGDGLVLLDGRRGVFQVGLEPPTAATLHPWLHFDIDLEAAEPAHDGRPTLTARDGSVAVWEPGSEPTPLGVRGEPGDAAQRIPGEILLFRRLTGGGDLSAIALDNAQTLWSRPLPAVQVLPVDEGSLVVVERMGAGPLVCLDPRTGRERWRADAPRHLELVGRVGDRVWSSRRGGELVAHALDNGQQAGRVALDRQANPRGVLDRDGRMHLTTGLEYAVADLSAGELLHETRFEEIPGGGTTANGAQAVATADGRLLFFDDRGRLFQVVADDPGRPVLVHETGDAISSWGVAHGRIFALGRRTLHLLRSASESGPAGRAQG